MHVHSPQSPAIQRSMSPPCRGYIPTYGVINQSVSTSINYIYIIIYIYKIYIYNIMHIIIYIIHIYIFDGCNSVLSQKKELCSNGISMFMHLCWLNQHFLWHISIFNAPSGPCVGNGLLPGQLLLFSMASVPRGKSKIDGSPGHWCVNDVYVYIYGIHILHSDVSCRSYPGICFLMISLDIWNDTSISKICSFGYII